MKLHFLGTGGGRYVTAEQKRRTAGIILESEESQLYIDPGPGALVHSQTHNTENLKGLIVSHAHLDHSNDAEPIIEKIIEQHNNSCIIAGSESALKGHADIEKTVSNYHQSLCTNTINLNENQKTEVGNLTVKAQEMFHTDPKCVGFKISDGEQKIGFWTDTQCTDELTSFYSDCNIIVIYCINPKDSSSRGHTSLSDVPDILQDSEASTAIITHFGYKFLESDMNAEKKWLSNEVDQKIIFAEDEMTFPGDRKLNSF